MTRIFSVLALLAIALLAANIYLGLRIGDLNGAYLQLREAQSRLAGQRDVLGQPRQTVSDSEREVLGLYQDIAPLQQRATLHRLCGVLAALIALLVNSISVTYFIGTSRWCREVVNTYALDAELATRANALKRRAFPWALSGIAVILAIVALGAASDPGTLRQATQHWVLPHYAVALAGVFLVSVSLLVQVNLIGDNSQIIEEVLANVRRIRQQRGLDVEQ